MYIIQLVVIKTDLVTRVFASGPGLKFPEKYNQPKACPQKVSRSCYFYLWPGAGTAREQK